jgi:hypothetical protein
MPLWDGLSPWETIIDDAIGWLSPNQPPESYCSVRCPPCSVLRLGNFSTVQLKLLSSVRRNHVCHHPLIPAKAGIQPQGIASLEELDSRFRGNERLVDFRGG